MDKKLASDLDKFVEMFNLYPEEFHEQVETLMSKITALLEEVFTQQGMTPELSEQVIKSTKYYINFEESYNSKDYESAAYYYLELIELVKQFPHQPKQNS